MTPEIARLRRHARPGPRYTSYPTVPHWGGGAPGVLQDGLASLRGDIAVYVHVPFCREQCLYCGCTMVVARQQAAGDRYLDALAAQLAAWPALDASVRMTRLHLGGGTPTWLTPTQLERLFGIVGAYVRPGDGLRASVEAAPEQTTEAHLRTLARHGVTRVSFGVQSLDRAVCEAVDRVWDPDGLRALVRTARDLGLRVNLDLVYGLPRQGVDGWAATLDAVCEMAPDRLAVFGYAHVPWLKPHQAVLADRDLPDATARLTLLAMAHQRLARGGWERVGFDHFARPDDPLAIAAREGRMHRDFMGFTDRPRQPMLGLGPSAISELPDRYVQQVAGLGAWLRAARAGEEAVARAHVLSADDQLRKDAILALTCQHELDADALAAVHGPSARQLLDVPAVQAWVDEGVVARDGNRLRLAADAVLLSRQVAQAFDAYLGEGARHSAAV